METPRSLTDRLAPGYAAGASSTGADATFSRQWFEPTGASPRGLSWDEAVAATTAALGVAA